MVAVPGSLPLVLDSGAILRTYTVKLIAVAAAYTPTPPPPLAEKPVCWENLH